MKSRPNVRFVFLADERIYVGELKKNVYLCTCKYGNLTVD